MNRFEQTNIWQKTLAKQLEPDLYEKERDILRVEFENFREKANLLSAEISAILPDFTVHDITHIDALWDTANLVVNDESELTPTEAYVLGGAFLIHDLGMGLASFPKGLDELKKEPIWQDTVASLFKKKYHIPIQNKDLKSLNKDIEKEATENVLRLLHAKHAEVLALISWENDKKENLFLIENTNLRESYGQVIGLIGYSHWWSVKELEENLPSTLGAPGMFPSDWTVDSIKLACILRIADAIQIDDRRAPSFLRAIRKPNAYSDSHWNFQQKLYQPRLERNRIIFSSKSSFTIDEVDSWWICYDTLKMIDNELKEVDSLLTDLNKNNLNAVGVASIEDPKRLSKLITVKDWQPIDAQIKVTDVAKLVGSLGGEQLYGKNLLVPIREIIQNASDAIRARRILEDEPDDFGSITIEIGKDTHGDFIEITDNGVGMSQRVLTGPFLDFGQSFWGTPLMHEELPSLESKGFSSTGKYGVGFFSIFMIAEQVSVTSKRFEEGRDKSLLLEFKKGINSRPILRKAQPEEIIKDGGTRIKFWVKKNIINKLLTVNDRNYKKISLNELIENLCPSIDCNIDIKKNQKTTRVISANDWLTIPPMDLIKRISGRSNFNKLIKADIEELSKISENMTIIEDENGQKIARALIYGDNDRRTHDSFFPRKGVVTLGGFKSCGLTGLIGVFIGKSDRASRDIGIPVISNNKLSNWATDQADKLANLSLDLEVEIKSAAYIRVCDGNTNNLKIAYHKTGLVNKSDITKIINKIDVNEVIVVQDASVNIYENKNNCKVIFNDNVFWVDVGMPGIFQSGSIENHVNWPHKEYSESNRFQTYTLEGIIHTVLADVWECSLKDLLEVSNESSDGKSFKANVGTVKNKTIKFKHLDIMKKPI
ncbi:MAG: ATP-binding protein [Candidatus Muirbacterium halophilum]|nr:ATP-binding protein [Candidatus Muirbacterium halophilum]